MTLYSDIAAAALEWAAKGLRVLPLTWPISSTQCSCGKGDCRSIGKHPIYELTRNGLKQASTDPQQIALWWSAYPEANVAVVTGDGVVVIDEDKPGALAEWVAGRDLPPTLEVQTGKGTHHYYRITGPVKNRVGLAPGIDVRGDHGYVVAPPSIHYTGALYEVSEDREIADCPEWLRAILQPVRQQVQAPAGGIVIRGTSGSGEHARLQAYALRTLSSCCEIVAAAFEGTRNHTLNTNAFLIGTILGASWPHGLSRSECESRLWQAAQRAGLAEREALRTIKSGLDAGVKRPRPMPVSRSDLVSYVRHTAEVAAQRVQEQAEPEFEAAEAQEIRRELYDSLTKDDKGKIAKSTSNLYRIVQGDPALQNCMVYNIFARAVCSLRELPATQGLQSGAPFVRGQAWRDVDDSRLKVWLQDIYHTSWAIEDVAKTVNLVADTRHWHPVRERLEAIEWHGDQLLDRWLIDYLGADDTAYTRAVSRKWLVSAVARIYQPGCKAECMLVLEGEQGIGKSSAIRALALDPHWFSDSELSLDDAAQSAQALHGKLIIEVPELSALSKAQVETIKAYLSRQIDHYRAPYEKRAESIPRQSIFAGSTNDTQYLKDSTGNRRFWPVRCAPPSGKADILGLSTIVEQLWAEARQAYLMGETWWLDDQDHEALAIAKDIQESRTEDDPWVELLRERLDLGVRYVTTDDVAQALGIDIAKLDPRTGLRFGKVLRALGLTRKRISVNGQRVYAYVPSLKGDCLPSASPSTDERQGRGKPLTSLANNDTASPIPPSSSYNNNNNSSSKTAAREAAEGSGEVEKKARLLVIKGGQSGTEVLSASKSLDNMLPNTTVDTRVGGQAEEGRQAADILSEDDKYAIDERAAMQQEAGVDSRKLKCTWHPRLQRERYIRWHKAHGLPVPPEQSDEVDDEGDEW
jgi:predicted P-loop ATPase